jgi:hypothetical protein
MDANRVGDLQRMYALFSRVNALELLRQALSAYIKMTGHNTVMDEEKDKDMVSWLLDLKARLDVIWEESFSKNESFSNTLKDAFEHLINLRQVFLTRTIVSLFFCAQISVAILDYFCTWNCVLQCGSSYLNILYFVVDITTGDSFFSTRQVALKCPTPTSQSQIRSLNRELAKTFDVLTFGFSVWV